MQYRFGHIGLVSLKFKKKNIFRMKEKIEREHDLQVRREELRLIRQQEAEDRKWRRQEMEAAQARAVKEAEIKMILDEQIRYQMTLFI